MRAEGRFFPGQLVRHKRYGYRGVVGGRDSSCHADDGWYWGNRTQPDRDQPWYHILVHGGAHTTYVAEENLDPYDGAEQVMHPLTKELFASFGSGRYQPREGIAFPAQW